MLAGFLLHLRAAGLPVSIQEMLVLLRALERGVCAPTLDEFYLLCRLCLVKDETRYDRFDRAFGEYVRGSLPGAPDRMPIPEDWFRDTLRRALAPEELARLEKFGWQRLMEELRRRLQEQEGAHHGGNRWIGTGGTSPFGHGGAHPEGVRIGGPSKGGAGAVKTWEQRRYRDYDDRRELGTRTLQLALRRLRRFAREGAELELDLPDTIRATAHNAGHLDLKLVAQRRNRVRVLMLLDVGGSMDGHVRAVEELFSAARSQFQQLQFYYFHNCVYDHVWRDNRRRHGERCETTQLLRQFGRETRLVLVGDATMSPYEILQAHGALEFDNAEPGAVWLQRLAAHFTHHAWINPESEALWDYRPSISIIGRILGGRMFPLTAEGLTRAMRALSR
jgi:uncharacterized protein with von Willebrand factor type A (vWA) domain